MKPLHRSWLAVALFIPLAALLVGTFACLPAPVGDPDQSKIDETLSGAYRGMGGGADDLQLVLLRPWDAHTYLIQYYTVAKKDGKEDHNVAVFKGWLTSIAGKTFLTAQPMDDLKFVLGDDGNKPYWVVMRLDKVPAGVEASTVNVESALLKGLTKREEFEAAIRAHAGDKELYTDNSPLFKKLGKEDQAFLDDILAKFNTKK